MLPNQSISSDKSIRFSPLAAAQPLTILSWPEALDVRGSKKKKKKRTRKGDSHRPEKETATKFGEYTTEKETATSNRVTRSKV